MLTDKTEIWQGIVALMAPNWRQTTAALVKLLGSEEPA
jgi:hypothetical protein